MVNPREPAFPVANMGLDGTYGLTKREWFAGMALQGLLAGYWGNPEMNNLSHLDIAQESLVAADALILELSK